jgi:hypothetical protein
MLHMDRLLRRGLLLCCFAGLATAFAGCGGGGGGGSTTSAPAPGTTPQAFANAVAYAGQSVDSIQGTGTFALAIVTNGTTLTGTWGAAYPTFLDGGTFNGTLSGTTFTGTGLSNVGSSLGSECSFTITGTIGASGLTNASYYSTAGSCNSDSAMIASAPTVTLAQVPSESGTITDTLAGAGTIALATTQYNVFIAGSYTDTFGSGATQYNTTGGIAYGVVTGPTTVEYYLISNNGNDCSLIAPLTISGTTISGPFNGQSCQTGDKGTLTL